MLANRDKASITVKLTVDAGPEARFGPTEITGLVAVDGAYVRRRVPWQQGDRYNAEKLAELRRALTDSRLFSSIKITADTKLDAQGELPVTVALSEGKPRSVGVGASYSTNEGPGGKVFWEHRNLFGEAESLHLELNASFIGESGTADFRKPDFLTRDQDLLGNIFLRNQTTEAYTSRISAAARRSSGASPSTTAPAPVSASSTRISMTMSASAPSSWSGCRSA